jgi:hypothetical protein
MALKSKLAIAGVLTLTGVGAAGSAFGQAQKVTGPIAQYWVSADTTSGMLGAMAGMAESGKRPGMGAIMGMAMGRGGGTHHTLRLQLGSSQAAAGAPQADHLPSPDLGAGQDLPLLSPERYVSKPEGPTDPRPPNMQKPEGRILIYWGCGEHAPPGQPVVIDLAKITQGQFPNLQTIQVHTERPPSPDRFKSYGEWPNQKSRTQVPPDGSLVGPHTVKANYSPQINFTLGPNQDFLAPLNITGQQPTPGGGTRLTWNPVPQSTGYFAWMMGAGGGGRGGGGGTDLVMWTSSNAQSFMGDLMDYIPPSEARRLVASGAVMSPQATSCVIPAEVATASPAGLLSMIAYGDEVEFVDPPRPGPKAPWNISWRVKVRYKSTTGTMMGMPAMGAMGDSDQPQRRGQQRGQQQQQQQEKPPSIGRSIGGALLRGGLGF